MIFLHSGSKPAIGDLFYSSECECGQWRWPTLSPQYQDGWWGGGPRELWFLSSLPLGHCGTAARSHTQPPGPIPWSREFYRYKQHQCCTSGTRIPSQIPELGTQIQQEVLRSGSSWIGIILGSWIWIQICNKLRGSFWSIEGSKSGKSECLGPDSIKLKERKVG